MASTNVETFTVYAFPGIAFPHGVAAESGQELVRDITSALLRDNPNWVHPENPDAPVSGGEGTYTLS